MIAPRGATDTPNTLSGAPTSSVRLLRPSGGQARSEQLRRGPDGQVVNKYRPPCIAVRVKIYTRTGDSGSTGLRGGKRISKGSTRIMAYGTVDEANSSIGAVLADGVDPDISDLLTRIQNDLFIVGSDLSSPDLSRHQDRVTPKMVKQLDSAIDRHEQDLPPISNFILPGGSRQSALIHVARTVVRRAEAHVAALAADERINSHCLAYLNRLSDLLFVLARTANRRSDVPDVVWTG